MTDIREIIKEMPEIKAKKSENSANLAILAVKSIVSQIVDFLNKELPRMKLNVNSEDSVRLSRDILLLANNVDSIQTSLKGDVQKFTSIVPTLNASLSSIKQVLASIEALDMGKKVNVKLSAEDIKKIKPKDIKIPAMPKKMEVSNLGDLKRAIESLEDTVQKQEFPDEVTVKNLKEIKVKVPEIKLPKKTLNALDKLNLLSKDPDGYISVRLSDQEGFYKAIGNSVGGAVSTTNPSFRDADGNPDRPFMDGNKVLKTVGDNYRKEITYVASGNGAGEIEYIGLAVPGTATSASIWQIQKLIYDGNDKLTQVLWADGNDSFDNIFDNRAALSYS